MSGENARLFRDALDVFNRRDKAAWLALCDPEYENSSPSGLARESASLRRTRSYLGVLHLWNMEPWEEAGFEIGELIDAGTDKVAAHQQTKVRGKASGASLAFSYWHVVTFRRGKALRSEWFTDRAEALEAAGARE